MIGSETAQVLCGSIWAFLGILMSHLPPATNEIFVSGQISAVPDRRVQKSDVLIRFSVLLIAGFMNQPDWEIIQGIKGKIWLLAFDVIGPSKAPQIHASSGTGGGCATSVLENL